MQQQQRQRPINGGYDLYGTTVLMKVEDAMNRRDTLIRACMIRVKYTHRWRIGMCNRNSSSSSNNDREMEDVMGMVLLLMKMK